MVISLTLGILKGEGPDAAASAGRFVSLAPEDAFESENLLMAHNPCSAVGTGCGSRTLRSNWEQYTAANHLHFHVRNESIDAFPRIRTAPPPRLLAQQKHCDILVNILLEVNRPSICQQFDSADFNTCAR